MHALAKLYFKLLKFALHLLLYRLPQHGKPPFSRLAAHMRVWLQELAVVCCCGFPCCALVRLSIPFP